MRHTAGILASLLIFTACSGPASSPAPAAPSTRASGLSGASLLHTTWTLPNPSSQVAVAAPVATQPSHPSGTGAPALSSGPFWVDSGYDPMVAVSPNFMIVTEDHMIEFRDSIGNILFSDALLFSPKEPLKMSATSFFGGFLYPRNADSSVNTNNVNLVAGFPSGTCDTSVFPPSSGAGACINEFFDTRVAYADGHFFIVSEARNQYKKTGDATTDPLVRRYYAFAVSNDEDPRHGFQQYMVYDSNYADWPLVSVHGDNLLIAHLDGGESGKPVLTVFSIKDMLAGQMPANFSYYASDVGGDVVPVTQYESNWGYTLFARTSGSKLTLFGFLGDAHQSTRPSLMMSSTTLASKAGFGTIIERAGFLHGVTSTELSPFTANVQVSQDCVRSVRVPVTFIGSTSGGISFALSSDAADGFRDGCIFVPTDAITRQKPAMTVTAAGDEVFLYGMAAIRTSFIRNPDVHYTIWYHDEPAVRVSGVLATGAFQPTELHKVSSNPDTYETTATPMLWENGVSADFAWATTAPDGYTVILSHSVPVATSKCPADSQCQPVSAGGHFPYRQVFGRLVP